MKTTYNFFKRMIQNTSIAIHKIDKMKNADMNCHELGLIFFYFFFF